MSDPFSIAASHPPFNTDSGLTITMATPGVKPLGVTAPLSMAMPTEAENQASNALIEELKRQNNYESAADTNKR